MHISLKIVLSSIGSTLILLFMLLLYLLFFYISSLHHCFRFHPWHPCKELIYRKEWLRSVLSSYEQFNGKLCKYDTPLSSFRLFTANNSTVLTLFVVPLNILITGCPLSAICHCMEVQLRQRGMQIVYLRLAGGNSNLSALLSFSTEVGSYLVTKELLPALSALSHLMPPTESKLSFNLSKCALQYQNFHQPWSVISSSQSIPHARYTFS